MLAETGLLKELWAEAAATQIHTRNCLPSAQHEGMPEERWSGKRHDIAYLRSRCVAFAKVPKELVKSKLKPKSVKCIMVGYAVIEGYCLFDRTSRMILTSCDIIFDEGSGHRTHIIANKADNLLSLYDVQLSPITQTTGVLTLQQPVASRVNSSLMLHKPPIQATDPAKLDTTIPKADPEDENSLEITQLPTNVDQPPAL